MIHVLLLILKIIGITLLVILGLLILILGLVLFLPMRYKLVANCHEKNRIRCQLTWLMHLFRAYVSYDEDFKYSVKFAWFTLFSSEPKKVKKTKKVRTKKASKSNENKAVQENDYSDVDADDKEDGQVLSIQELKGHTKEPENIESKSGDANLEEERPSIFDKFKKHIANIKDKVMGIFKLVKGLINKSEQAINSIKEKIQKAREFVGNEQNRECFSFLRKQLGKLLRHISPYKYNIKVRFGADSPDITGQVTGIYSIAWAFLNGGKGRHGTFLYEPVFTEKVFDADCLMKGRIRVFNLALIALRVYMNPHTKKLLGK